MANAPGMPADPDTLAMLNLLKQYVGAIHGQAITCLGVVAIRRDGVPMVGIHCTETTNYTLLRGACAELEDMVVEDRKELQQDGPTNIVDPGGAAIR